MKKLLTLLAVLALNLAARGQKTLEEFKWTATTAPPGGAAVQMDGRDALKIDNTKEPQGLQLPLLTIQKPKIASTQYAVEGEVRYDGVEGDGFLEMWNYFPPAGQGQPESEYFSRTLGESGEMGKITGTSGWRKFVLPFNSTGAPDAPTRLQINLILKGKGTVYLGPLKLVQYADAKAGGSMPVWFFGDTDNPWWSAREGIWGSNIVTVLLVIYGVWIGVLCQKGKSREFVLSSLKIWIALGAVSFAAALVAFARHQPYMVWFPLSLYGLLLLILAPVFMLTWGRHYRRLELRRMQALDALG